MTALVSTPSHKARGRVEPFRAGKIGGAEPRVVIAPRVAVTHATGVGVGRAWTRCEASVGCFLN